ncbi:hypothetical protein [Nannocystis pusilla]|uniref:hypothetical protein n=1 Tax=Nannocystis pusilla TaxID=889268 RepID=UPI003BF06667
MREVFEVVPRRWRGLGEVAASGHAAASPSASAWSRPQSIERRVLLDKHLAPKLRPGDIVVMDNLEAHHPSGVRERALPSRGDIAAGGHAAGARRFLRGSV